MILNIVLSLAHGQKRVGDAKGVDDEKMVDGERIAPLAESNNVR